MPQMKKGKGKDCPININGRREVAGLLLGEQRELLKNPVLKLYLEPGTFSASGEHYNHSAAVN